MDLRTMLAAWLMFGAGMAVASTVAIGAALYFMRADGDGVRSPRSRAEARRDRKSAAG